VALFTKAATVNPQQAANYLQKGFSLKALGRLDDALLEVDLRDLHKAGKLYPIRIYAAL